MSINWPDILLKEATKTLSDNNTERVKRSLSNVAVKLNQCVCGWRVGCKQIHNKPLSSAANTRAFLYYGASEDL